jgi:diaminopimelate decarboxylase
VQLRDEGDDIRRLDLGGGLGIPYAQTNEETPLPSEFGAMIKNTVGHLGCEIEIEPGRLIAGNAGLLVSGVIYVKSGDGRDFLILDAAMNDLIRPAMYEAYHEIVPVQEPEPGVEQVPYDVVGPVWESGDTFAKQRMMPPLRDGALVAFRSAGAYGAVMSSEYNTRPLIPEVLVHGERFHVVRPRVDVETLIAMDSVPDWL